MNPHLVSILPDEHMESKDKHYKDQNSNIKRSNNKREVASPVNKWRDGYSSIKKDATTRNHH